MARCIEYNADKFNRLLDALSEKERLRAMKRGMRRMATKLRRAAIAEMPKNWRSNKALIKGVQIGIFKRKAGFRVHVAANKATKKGMYLNRFGLLKPVLLWGEDGTEPRFTRRSKASRGKMAAELFLVKARDAVASDLPELYRAEMMNQLSREALKYGVTIQ